MSTPASDSKKLVFIDPEHVNHNLKVNKTIYEFLSVVAGLVCGVLGLTDLRGVLAFLVFNALIGLVVLAKTGFNLRAHFLSWDKVFVEGAAGGFGTFVLFWTLFYNIAHLF